MMFGWLRREKRRPSTQEIEDKLDSDRPIEHSEVSGAIQCALKRLDTTMSSSSEHIERAAKRLRDESKQTRARLSVPPTPEEA